MSSCSQPEYLNPSSASEVQVVNDVNGLIALCNGLQYKFTVGRASPGYTAPSAAGLTTGELIVLNAGNADEDFLSKGAATISSNNGIVLNIWAQCNLTKSNADIVLNNASKITDAGIRSGVVAYASIFKAMALGTMAQFFEKVTVQVGVNAPFVDRTEALKTAISTLESAATQVASTAPSAAFAAKIPAGIDIPNTIQALIARYSNMLGDNDKAIAAADKVDLTKKSSYSFDEISRNAMFESTFSNRNVTEPTNVNFGLPVDLRPATTDKRRAFYFQTAAAAKNLGTGFFTANSTSVPVYLSGEMLLIKAEAQARKNNLTAAVTELNKVITKTTDTWGVAAGEPAYAGASTQTAILTEIYKQRCVELYLSGMKLEDSRRFGRPGPGATGAERNRNFYPYPQNERDNNTNTPADPAN